MFIYHVVRPEIWKDFSAKKSYRAASLTGEGFIHCSFENQLAGVLERYYSGTERLIILKIDSDKLESDLIIEPSTNGENYPHIYGEINRESIVGLEQRDSNG